MAYSWDVNSVPARYGNSSWLTIQAGTPEVSGSGVWLMLEHLLRGEVLDGPQDHDRGRVPLQQPEPGVRPVVVLYGVELQRVDPERGVLEGVGVLVGVGHPGLGGQARIGHDHHLVGDIVVVAQDLAGEQLEQQIGVVLVRGEEAQRMEQRVVRGPLIRRVILLEPLGQPSLDLLAGHQLRRADVGSGQVANVGHVGLDGGQLVLERGRGLVAGGGGGAGRRWAGT